MKAPFARALYSALIWAAQPVLLRKLRRRARTEPGYMWAVGQRFGYYTDPAIPAATAPTTAPASSAPLWIWIHAVSLGETRAAAILLRALRHALPQMRLLLTHSTATGRTEGHKLLQPGDVQVWLPWDTPKAVGRFLHHFRPTLGILMETEVWPNMVARCRAHGIPLVLANARLNAQSLRKSLRLRWLAQAAYQGLTAVWAQSTEDAQRLRVLGAPVQGVLGNLKFDSHPDTAQQEQGRAWRAAHKRPVVMLASSREGEELLWLHALNEQRQLGQAQLVSSVQWLIVPRHPQRFAQVHELLEAAQWRVIRRSTWATYGPAPSATADTTDVWLGDSLGEMALYYSLADVALLGGSFAPLGGQNLIEAAACGCPVVLGPHTFNFAQAAQWACAAGAAQRVTDLGHGITAACTLAHERTQWAQAQQHALDFAQAHQGAAQATVAAVCALITNNLNNLNNLNNTK